MIHPDTEVRYIDEKIGYGVFAKRLIPRGTIIWTRCKLEMQFRLEDLRSMSPVYYPSLVQYTTLEPEGYLLLSWDHEKFVNHSCEPTNQALTEEISIVVRDVHPDEQITYDYSSFIALNDLECFCQSKHCRKLIRNEDVTKANKNSHDLVSNALPDVVHVEQPLYPYIQNQKHFKDIVTKTIKLPLTEEIFSGLTSTIKEFKQILGLRL